MDQANMLKFILLVLALPGQYFISQYWSNNSNEQSEAIRNLVLSVSKFKTNYLELESWKKWYLSLVLDIPTAFSGKVLRKNKESNKMNLEYDDDIAVEVLTYRKSLSNFGESSMTRSPRPSKVLYRVGQVIRHKRLNIRGVIIGWDEHAKAPIDWIERNYNEEERKKYLDQPHYLILVDEKFQNMYASKAYIVQEDIEIISNVQIQHRNLNSYLGYFDGEQYLLKKFLQTVYPHD